MKHRLTDAILLLYPRRVRERHGPELMALIDDLIAHDRRSRTRLLTRLAVDGLVQRIASTATVWTVAAVLAATCFGGLAGSDFSAAHALQRVPRAVRPVAPARHAHPTPHHLPRSHHTPGRAAGMTTRRLIQTTLTPTVTRVQPGRGHPAADEDELAQRGKRNPGFRWASPLLVGHLSHVGLAAAPDPSTARRRSASALICRRRRGS